MNSVNQLTLFNTKQVETESLWRFYLIVQVFESKTFCEAYREYITGIQE